MAVFQPVCLVSLEDQKGFHEKRIQRFDKAAVLFQPVQRRVSVGGVWCSARTCSMPSRSSGLQGASLSTTTGRAAASTVATAA